MKMRYLKFWFSAVVVLTTGFFTACDEDDPPLPDNILEFETSAVGFEDEQTSVDVKLQLTRAEESDASIVVTLAPTGVTYGTEFTTDPAASSGDITVVIPAGSTEGSFTVTVADDIFLAGDENVIFSITEAPETVVIGETDQLTLSFAPIVSEGSQLQLNGLIDAESGSLAGNSVFVDLSNNTQTPVARTSWDLGFYGGDDFRVIINNVSGASVLEVDDTDLTAVTDADINPDDLVFGFNGADIVGSLEVVDDVFGQLENTAIAQVSATDDDNKVYVINRVGGNGTISATDDLVKIRVLRNGDGYTLQYAKLNESTFTSVDIAKDANLDFSYFSFDDGAVSFAPPKAEWDIQWSWTIFRTENPPGTFVPFAFSDFVTINHLNGVEVDTVFTENVAYDDFTEADLADYELVSDRNTIGSGWRVTAPGGPDPIGVKTDRFYVIRDVAGNVYKLKFVSFHPNDGGTRGRPIIEYALVKKAE